MANRQWLGGGLLRLSGVLLLAGLWLAQMPSAAAIEVTYGEDYVERPNTRGDDDFINLGYGIDPIPAKSPTVRFNDWRAYRAKARAEKAYRRHGVQPQTRLQPQPTWEQIPAGTQMRVDEGAQSDAAQRPLQSRPTSRRANQTKQAPRQF